jgi:hypothetical protein
MEVSHPWLIRPTGCQPVEQFSTSKMLVVRDKLEAYLPSESRSLRVGQETSAFRSTLNQRLLNPGCIRM